MIATRPFNTGKVGFILCASLLGMLTGCVHAQPPAPRVQATVVVGLEIHAESDFYEPLAAHGEWVVVGTYGRCWRPARMEASWRPYCNGHWQHTEAGWYWASEEPWGWATYHYGRWNWDPEFGWYWVPMIQWAPAWVSWHEGGGYVGWAPMHPSARVSSRGSVAVNVTVIAPRAYVFVESRHFLQPVRPSTVVVHNTTIINKTVNITNVRVVNKIVINEGPRTTVIEQASGRKVQPVALRELREKEEAPVIARRRSAPGNSDRQAPGPGRAAEPIGKKNSAKPERARETQPQIQEEPRKTVGEPRKKSEVESDQRQKEAQKPAKELPGKGQRELERDVKAAEQKAPAEQELRTRQPGTKAPTEPQRPGKEKKDVVKKGPKGTDDKNPGKKPEPTSPEKPVEPPSPSKN